MQPTSVPVELRGVTISANVPCDVQPAEPGPDETDVLWSTAQVALYTSVLMTDGTRWVVRGLRMAPDGSVIVTLYDATETRSVGYTVDLEALGAPIWFVGEPPPPPIFIQEAVSEPAAPIEVPPILGM